MSDDAGPAPERQGRLDPEAPLAPLAELDDLPTADHVARFDAVHDRLRNRLDAAPDDGPGA